MPSVGPLKQRKELPRRHLRGFDGLVRRQAYVIRDGCRVSKMGSAWLDSLRGMSKNLVSSNLGVVPQLCLRFADSVSLDD